MDEVGGWLDDQPNRLTFALDYDGTFTEDPDLWYGLIRKIRERGHRVIVVTMREPISESADVNRHLLDKVDRIVFTNRKGKLRHMEFLGIRVDIWIDDRPDFILYDAAPKEIK